MLGIKQGSAIFPSKHAENLTGPSVSTTVNSGFEYNANF